MDELPWVRREPSDEIDERNVGEVDDQRNAHPFGGRARPGARRKLPELSAVRAPQSHEEEEHAQSENAPRIRRAPEAAAEERASDGRPARRVQYDECEEHERDADDSAAGRRANAEPSAARAARVAERAIATGPRGGGRVKRAPGKGVQVAVVVQHVYLLELESGGVTVVEEEARALPVLGFSVERGTIRGGHCGRAHTVLCQIPGEGGCSSSKSYGIWRKVELVSLLRDG